jgi:hypothetical protein
MVRFEKKLLFSDSLRILLSVDLFPHFFTWAERNHLPLFNGDGLSGSGIATAAGLFVPDIEGAKMDKLDGFAIKQPILHSVEKGVDQFRASALGVPKLGGKCFGQFFAGKITFIHINLL